MKPLTDLATTRATFAALQARLQVRIAAGMPGMRPPPAEPSSCCGRGCNGCVWESFYAAANYWCEQALTLLDGATD